MPRAPLQNPQSQREGRCHGGRGRVWDWVARAPQRTPRSRTQQIHSEGPGDDSLSQQALRGLAGDRATQGRPGVPTTVLAAPKVLVGSPAALHRGLVREAAVPVLRLDCLP